MTSLHGTRKCCAGPLTLAALLTAVLTGCAAIHGTAMRASGACIAFSPITYSARGDSRATVSQVRGHNAAWDAICRDLQ